jgi:hypothetical protein
MSRNLFDDSRDETLARALQDAAPRPPIDDVDWMALHARITGAAQPQLAQPAASPWWQPIARWSPRGIPLAAAATVLLMIGAGLIGRSSLTTPSLAAADAGFVMVEEELVNGVPVSARPLLAGVEAHGMIDAALFYDREDW